MPPVPSNQGRQGTIFGGQGYEANYQPSVLSEVVSSSFDRLSQSLTTAVGAMAGGAGYIGGNPFQPTSDLAYAESQRRLAAVVEDSHRASVELMRIDSQRVNALAQGIAQATMGPLSESTRLDIARQADALAGLTTSRAGSTLLGAVGIDPSWINPNINLPQDAYRLLRTASPGLDVNAPMLGQLAAELGKSAGVRADGSIDPGMSQGFSAAEQAGLARVLQSRGLLGLGIDDTLGRLSESERAALKSGDPAGVDAFSRLVGARVESSVQTFLPSLATARGVFGTSDPSELFQSIQSVTGGGLGQMTPGQVQSQLEVLKRVSDSAGIAVRTLVEFIDQSVALAQQNGLSGAAAARGSLVALQQASSSSQRFTELAGLVTPGINRDPMALVDDIQMRQMSAQASPLATAAAIATRELQQFANIRGLSGIDQIQAPDAASRQLITDLQGLRNGSLGSEGLDRLRSNDAIAGALSRITGASSQSIVEQLGDQRLGQIAMAQFPEFASSIADMQVVERAGRRVSDVSRVVGRGVTSEEAAALLSTSLVNGEDVRSFASTLESMGQEDPTRFGRLRGLIQTDNPAQLQSGTNMMNQLASMASELNISQGQAISLLGQNRARMDIGQMTSESAAAWQLNQAIGGVPAVDHLLQSLQAGSLRGGAAEALGASSRAEIIDRISRSNIPSIIERGGPVADDLRDMISMIAPEPSRGGVESAGSAAPSRFSDILGTLREAIIQGFAGVTIVVQGGDGGRVVNVAG